MRKSTMGLKTNVIIREIDKDGNEKIVKRYRNTLRQAGLEGLIKQMAKLESNKYPAKIGVGISSASPNNPPATLTDPTIKDILEGDITFQGNSLFLVVTMGFTDAVGSWNEIGILFPDSTIIARTVPNDPYQKTDTISASIQWQISLSEI